MRTRQLDTYQSEAAPRSSFDGVVTIGTVVDTNDPQQMGRIRVVCATLGENMRMKIEDLPWAVYVSPFAGSTTVGARGPGDTTSDGAVGYGFWARPKVGAQVVVMFIDGDPNLRVCVGGIYDQFRPHTMPHGRFMYEDHPALQKSDNRRPFGPYTSDEKYIEPLNVNMREAFPKSEPNFEWRTRVADNAVSAIDVSALPTSTSNVPDDKDVTFDGWTTSQGYQISRQDPDYEGLFGEGNLDSETYAWTTPGFHAIAMDDSQKNCRVRFRTTSGHQILMDDTNERVYIATAKGKNWIEMDQEGNIDIYTDNKVNVHAKQGINFTSDDSIRMFAKNGIHMYSDGEIRMQAKKDINVKTLENIRMRASKSMYMDTLEEINVRSGSDLKLTSGGTTHQNAGAAIIETAPTIHHNGPSAAVATTANSQNAMWTSRVPAHEPWARTMTKNDFTHDPEFPYTSTQVGRSERGKTIPRGKFWRR